MDDNCGEWVESMGVVRMYISVVSGLGRGIVVKRYIDFLIILLIPTPLILALFGSSIPTSLLIKKNVFRSLICRTSNYKMPKLEIC